MDTRACPISNGMKELQQRQKFKRRLYSMPSLAIALVLSVALVRGAYGILLTERESSREVGLLAAEVGALSAREVVLKAAIQKLQTEEGIEEEIKSKFNVAKPGEQVAVIVDRPERAASTTEQKVPWWKGLLNAIIGK